MLSINTNIASLIAQNNLKLNTLSLNKAIERLTTGAKINHASDDAANYSIATKLDTQLSAYDIASENVTMGCDLISSAVESIDLINEHMQRIRDLLEMSANDTHGRASRETIQLEIDARQEEITKLIDQCQYNGISVFKGGLVASTAKTKLENFGIQSGDVGVIVNGVEKIISISSNDTISTFMDKLNAVGVESSFNSETGILSIGIDANNIKDDKTLQLNGTLGTGLGNFLKLGSTDGYKSDKLETETTNTTYFTADRTTLLSDLGISDGSFSIIHSDGTNTNDNVDTSRTSIGDFLQKLETNYGIKSNFANGVISLDTSSGNYLAGNLADALGISFTSSTTTTTNAKATTSSNVIEYTTTTTAGTSTKLSEVGIAVGDTLVVTNSSGNTLYSTTADNAMLNTSIGDFLNSLSGYFTEANINSNGVITLKSNDGNYIQGTLADKLGIGVESASAGSTVGLNSTSSEQLTYTTTQMASSTSKLGELGITNSDKLVIYNPDNTVKTTISNLAETTIAGLNGIGGSDLSISVNNGVISVSSASGCYIQGDIPTKLGIGYNSTSSSSTVGSTVTSSEVLSYAITADATGETTLANAGVNESELVVNYQTTSVTATTTISTVTTTTTVVSTDTQTAITSFSQVKTQAEAEAMGYIWVTTREELEAAFASEQKQIMLGADIDLSGENWEPVEYRQLVGNIIFDGNGHTISNMTIDMSTMYAGFFSRFYYGTIKNLCFDNASVTNRSTSIASFASVICGFSTSSSSIINCVVKNSSVYGQQVTATGMSMGIIQDCTVIDTVLHGVDSVYGAFSTGDIGSACLNCNAINLSLINDTYSFINSSDIVSGGVYALNTINDAISPEILENVSGLSVYKSSYGPMFENNVTTSATDAQIAAVRNRVNNFSDDYYHETEYHYLIGKPSTGTKTTTISTTTTIDATATLAIAGTESFNDMFDKLSGYGITGEVTDGVINLTSTKGAWLSGALADELEITNTTTATVACSFTLKEGGTDFGHDAIYVLYPNYDENTTATITLSNGTSIELGPYDSVAKALQNTGLFNVEIITVGIETTTGTGTTQTGYLNTSNGTSFGALGIPSSCSFTIYNINDPDYKREKSLGGATTTLENMFGYNNDVEGYDFKVQVSSGTITISSDKGYYIEGELAEYLRLGIYSTGSTIMYSNDDLHTTSGGSITLSTTFAELGVYGSSNACSLYNPEGQRITSWSGFDQDKTIQENIQYINDRCNTDFRVEINGNRLIISSKAGYYLDGTPTYVLGLSKNKLTSSSCLMTSKDFGFNVDLNTTFGELGVIGSNNACEAYNSRGEKISTGNNASGTGDYNLTLSEYLNIVNSNLGTDFIITTNGSTVNIISAQGYYLNGNLTNTLGLTRLTVTDPQATYTSYYTTTITEATIATPTDPSIAVVSMTPELQEALGAVIGEGYSYNVDSVTTSGNKASKKLTTSISGLLDSSNSGRALSEFGLASGNHYFTINGNQTVTIKATDTAASMVSKLGNAGIQTTYNNDGTLIFTPANSSSAITGISSTLADFLGLQAGEGKTYTVQNNVSYFNTNSNVQKITSSIVLDSTSSNQALSKFGLASGNHYFTINGNQTVTIKATDTAASMVSKLSNAGIQTTYNNDGTLTFTPANSSNAITGISSTLADFLGLQAGEGKTYTIQNNVSYFNTASDAQKITSNIVLDSSNSGRTLSQFGLASGNHYFTINGSKTVTIKASDTVANMVNKLSNAGIQTTYNNDGTMTFTPANSSSAITGISSTLAAFLGLQAGEDKTYTTQEITLRENSKSNYMQDSLTTTTIQTATDKTLLSEFDTDTKKTAGNLVLNIDGNKQNVLISSNETIGSLIKKLAELGVNATLSDGVLVIDGQNGKVSIDSSNSTSGLTTNLGLNYASTISNYTSSTNLNAIVEKIAENQDTTPSEIVIQTGIYGKESDTVTINTRLALGQVIFDASSSENARNGIKQADEILKTLSAKQAEYGAAQFSLESALDSILINIENLTSTLSTIRDADLAVESSNYIKSQILQQASATILSAANQQTSALQLLQGLNQNSQSFGISNQNFGIANQQTSVAKLLERLNQNS